MTNKADAASLAQGEHILDMRETPSGDPRRAGLYKPPATRLVSATIPAPLKPLPTDAQRRLHLAALSERRRISYAHTAISSGKRSKGAASQPMDGAPGRADNQGMRLH